MHATSEELLLLLKRWADESKRVVAAGVIQPEIGFRSVFKVFGLVRVNEQAATFAIGDVELGFVSCHISALGAGYLAGQDADWSDHSEFLPDPASIEDVIVLRNSDRSTLCLYALKRLGA